MPEPLLSDGIGNFAMVPLDPDGPVVAALRERQLQPRDMAALWLLLVHLDWRSGRCWASSRDLAAAMGHRDPAHVVHSLARLKRLGLVAKGHDKRDPRRLYWCVNPWLVAATGGRHRRWLQQLQFEQAMDRLPRK